MMRTVIGVDPSLSCTGVAVWRNGSVRTFSVKTSPDDGPRVVREMIICAAIMPWVRGATSSMVEAVYQQKLRGRTSLDLAGLHDVLVYGLHARGVPVGVAAPTSVKQFATCNGRASKVQMVDDAEALLGIKVGDHNQADALWLATMEVVARGGQVNGWPPRSDHPIAVENQRMRAAVLAKVQRVGPALPDNWLEDL
jgi:Holliday junction resolvasome RuvABC endonuclease subunit